MTKAPTSAPSELSDLAIGRQWDHSGGGFWTHIPDGVSLYHHPPTGKEVQENSGVILMG